MIRADLLVSTILTNIESWTSDPRGRARWSDALRCGMNQAEELTKVCQTVAERSSRILGEFAQKQAQNMSAAVRDEMGIAKAFMDLYSRMAADPAAMASLSMSMWVDYARLWQSTWMKMMGVQAQPGAEPAKGDSRFKDEDW